MKHVFKQWLAGLLSIVMLLTLLPASVLAAEPDGTGEQITVQDVQGLIDALPDADTITADNRADVEAQLTAIDDAKLLLTGAEQDALDITRYLAAVDAILALDGMAGAYTPMSIDFPGNLSGSGTEEKPYQIQDATDLKKLSDYVNGGNNCQDTYFKLTADIDLGGKDKPWEPIGNSHNKFNGTFDGGGYTISGLYIDNANGENQLGLFGEIGSGGKVENLGVSGYIKDLNDREVGGIAGINRGEIIGCHSDCTIISDGNVGGIVGDNHGTVSDCYNEGEISRASNAGGIVGNNTESTGKVKNCYNTGSVSGSDAGGIAGKNTNYGTIENCYNVGTVNGSSTTGGIVGKNDNFGIEYKGVCTNCFSVENPIGTNNGTIDNVTSKTEAEFKSLASTLGEGWTDDPFLGRPVLDKNQEPWPMAGDGSPEHPFEIPDKATLEKVRDYINNSTDGGEGKTFKLTQDINLKGSEENQWTPIGNDDGKQFNATFDGDGHTISGLYISDSTGSYLGMFGYIGSDGVVKNLNVSGSVTGKSFVGGVAGSCEGTVTNCSYAGIVSGEMKIGGIVGQIPGSIPGGEVTGCYNTGKITGSGGSVGGVVGDGGTGSQITNCYNTGSISGSNSSVGGVVGDIMNGSVSDCYNTGAVSSTSTAKGVCGSTIDSTVTNCYYLNTTPADSSATSKTSAEFASGEVTYLLQGKQVEQVWGQTVGSGTPELTDSNAKKVFKITGKVDGQEDVVWYSNNKATLSTAKPSKEGYTFVGWSKTQSGTTADFEVGTPVTEDTTVYALFSKKGDGTGSITMADYTCGDTTVEPQVTTDTNVGADVTITYKAKGADDDAYTGTKPTTAGEYTVRAVFAATDEYNEVTATADFKITHQVPPTPGKGDPFECSCQNSLRLEAEQLSEVPPALTNKYNTVDELTQALLKVLVEETGISGENYVVYDVKLAVKEGSGDWHDAPEATIPEDDITITLPYPEGTDASYIFTVVHMFAHGENAGQTEMPSVTNTEYGVRFTVSGLSPICLSWTAPPDPPRYYVHIAPLAEGGTVAADETYVVVGDTVTLTVVPNSGYHLLSITVTGEGGEIVQTTETASNTYTFTQPDCDVTVSAKFAKNASSPDTPTRYQVSIPANTDHGQITTSSTRAAAGDTVVLTVTPDTGYMLDSITVTDQYGNKVNLNRIGSNTFSFVQPYGEVTVTATFVPIPVPGEPEPTYSITVPEKTEGGSVAVKPKSAKEGDTVTINVSPEDGYDLSTLTVTDKDGKTIELKANEDGTYTFKMPASAVAVKVEFVKCPSLTFPDLDPALWYHKHTDYVISYGLMQGTPDGLFVPNGTVTRAQMVTLLWNFMGKPVVDFLMAYPDVDPEAWYAEAVRWATSEQVVNGYGDGTFGPNDPITREQMAAMLYNYEKKYGDGGFTGTWMYRLPFEDLDQISDWAFEAVAWCNMNGVITGKENSLFDPKGQATRAEMAAILTGYLKLAEDDAQA